MNARKIKDHLGNEFNSKSEMARFYNLNYGVIKTRLNRGLSLKDALTTPIRKQIVKDHLNNEYKTIEEMITHYGLNRKQYDKRLKLGWSIEDTLTKPIIYNKSKPVTGPDGVEYGSVTAMCKAYNVDFTTYKKRIHRGQSMAEALSVEIETDETLDPFGNLFASNNQMVEHYNPGKYSMFQNRKNMGYSDIECLNLIPLLNITLKNYTIDDLTILHSINGSHQKMPEYFLCIYHNHETVFTRTQILNHALCYLKKHYKAL